MFDFFFDTANEKYIRETWDKLKNHYSPCCVRGITTNPNAMHKEGFTSLKSWEETLPKLCSLVSEIRGDDSGVVYVQLPNCNVTPDEALDWAYHISKFNDGQTKLGLKIPPYYDILCIIDELERIMETNVTGVADAATALSCFSFGPRYVSIIPGRMEEVGINATDHLLFSNQRGSQFSSEIISGSMRTIEGLKRTVLADTVPTIGSRVLDVLADPAFALQGYLDEIQEELELPILAPSNVLIDERNIKLSKDFFKQMDDLGRQVYEEWLSYTYA